MQEIVSSDDRSRGPIDTEGTTLLGLRAVVIELYKAVSSTLEGEREAARQYIERADLFLRSELSAPAEEDFAISDSRSTKHVRGLAPWQIRLVKTHIEANLDDTIGVKALAELVKLSSFHFCRAFRDSFGDSPHGYVMRRRVKSGDVAPRSSDRAGMIGITSLSRFSRRTRPHRRIGP
jgi:AraC family transcriptional regulator